MAEESSEGRWSRGRWLRGCLLCFFCFFFSSALSSSLSSLQSQTQTVDHQQLSSLLSSPSFFFSSDKLMLSSFKVFIYPSFFPSRPSSDLATLPLPPQSCDHLFFVCLSNSQFLSHDPSLAHLFFVPASLAAMRRTFSSSVGRNLNSLVQKVRDRYPFWQRALGADHFVASCQRFKPDGSRNVLELQKNAIWLACSELFGRGEKNGAPNSDGVVDSQFFPHKDITMPPFISQSTKYFPSNATAENQARTILVYVVNPPPSSALERWKRDSDFVIFSLNDDSTPYLDMLSISKFCLTYASLGPDTTIVEGMRLGCVPVIVSDGHLQGLPFQDILDWQKFSVIASISQLHKLKKYLTSISETNYRELQVAAMAASRHLEWHTPPKLYDAFHMLMHQLWLRRHAVRYSQTSTE